MNRWAAAMLLVLLAGCSTPPAPVVDRSQDPAASRIGGDGRYRVRSGDTLYTIAFRYGLDHRDLARWNDVAAPYIIYPDQLLRLSPPPGRASDLPETAAAQKPSRQLPVPAKRTAPAKTTARPEPSAKPPVGSAGAANSDPGSWNWPVKGRVLRGYLANDPSRNGLDIAGREGEPVRAAAAGSVVYSGNGLIGYGELIIIKHSERMLSAYAHNRERMVQEGERVKAGQQIASLGRNDRNQAMLHFEIRVNGKPVDPRRYLP